MCVLINNYKSNDDQGMIIIRLFKLGRNFEVIQLILLVGLKTNFDVGESTIA